MDLVMAIIYGMLMFYLAFFMTPDLAMVTIIVIGGIVVTASVKAIRRLGKG